LRNFVGLVAEREIADILQSGRRRPWNDRRTPEEPTEAEVGTTPGPEGSVAARELFQRVTARLREELSPQGYRLFEMLLVEDCAVEDACAATGMSRDAIYAWRSRLPKIIRRIVEAVST
jgi:RNA polymerase sigma-70 factor (ECF subfamily)